MPRSFEVLLSRLIWSVVISDTSTPMWLIHRESIEANCSYLLDLTEDNPIMTQPHSTAQMYLQTTRIERDSISTMYQST